MMNFCTYFDSYYLLKGLGLYKSLERVSSNYHLYVMAFDTECYERLESLQLEHMSVERVSDMETPELLAVKKSRSKVEYCMTLGPSVIYHFLTTYHLDSITYLDSDLLFLSDPQIVFDEVKGSSVAITEQGIDNKNARLYGKYCVQYLTFQNDEDGLGALKWWKDSCIEWCFLKFESTRYADQKYLDEFPKRWKKVYVIQNLGVGIAPWNMNKYKYIDNALIYQGEEYPFVFFHMHGVKIELVDNILHIRSHHSELNDVLIEKFYMPYAYLLKDVCVNYLGYKVDDVAVHNIPFMRKLRTRIFGLVRYNVFVRWVWFSLLHKKSRGYGSKI